MSYFGDDFMFYDSDKEKSRVNVVIIPKNIPSGNIAMKILKIQQKKI